METVKVISPIEDKGIRNNLNGSPIWTGLRYTESELSIAQKKHTELYEYSIKFEGLKPIQVSDVRKLTK
jgi:hypothetical protein